MAQNVQLETRADPMKSLTLTLDAMLRHLLYNGDLDRFLLD